MPPSSTPSTSPDPSLSTGRAEADYLPTTQVIHRALSAVTVYRQITSILGSTESETFRGSYAATSWSSSVSGSEVWVKPGYQRR